MGNLVAFDGICLDCTDDGFGVLDTFDEYSGEYRIMLFPYNTDRCVISFADNEDVQKAGFINDAPDYHFEIDVLKSEAADIIRKVISK